LTHEARPEVHKTGFEPRQDIDIMIVEAIGKQ